MRIVMMGTGTFAEPTLEALLAAGENVVGCITQPERDGGAKRGSTRQTGKGIGAIAAAAGVPVARPVSINTPEGLAELAAFAPELVVVAAYGQILKPAVIATPSRGMINVHASLLPKYRGAAPVAYAILRGETTTGVTIIRITPGLDSGAMLAQDSLAIVPTETAGELESRLAPLGARLCLKVIQELKSGEVVGSAQDPAGVTKAPKLTKEQGQIDWHQPAMTVDCQVRAMQPWPTAYTYLHRPNKPVVRLIVPLARPHTATDLAPGRLRLVEGVLLVGCAADTAVSVANLQPAGKRIMTAEEFFRGTPFEPDAHFGPELPL